MTTGTPAISHVGPAAAGPANRGAPDRARERDGGGHVGAAQAPSVRAAALPRPGVSSSTPAAARCTAAPQIRARQGWRPTPQAERAAVPAVQRSDLAAAATG